MEVGTVGLYYVNSSLHAVMRTIHPAITAISFKVISAVTSGIITIKQNVALPYTLVQIVTTTPITCPNPGTTGISNNINVAVNLNNVITINQISVLDGLDFPIVTVDPTSAIFTGPAPFGSNLSQITIITEPSTV